MSLSLSLVAESNDVRCGKKTPRTIIAAGDGACTVNDSAICSVIVRHNCAKCF